MCVKRFFRKQKGAALVYLAIGIVPLVATLGLVIDYGEAAVCANRMQRAVDAAALGGASHIPDSDAQYIAQNLAESNYENYDGYEVTINGDEISVSMKRSVPTRFMRIFGQAEVDVSVSAKAIAPQPVGKVKKNLMPFCLINPLLNNDPGDDLVPEHWGQEFIIFYGEDNCIVQDWVDDGARVPFNGDFEGPAPPGGNQSVSMGWRGALDLDSDGSLDGSGAADFKYNFANGWPGTADEDLIIPVETGNMSNPTEQGRAERLLGEEDELFENFDPRTDYGMGRVVLVPIVSLIHEDSSERYDIDDYYAGLMWDTRNVIIDGFAPFWVLTKDEQGNVDGDNNPNNDRDWVIGKYIPGTRISDSEGGGSDWGAKTPPRLVD